MKKRPRRYRTRFTAPRPSRRARRARLSHHGTLAHLVESEEKYRQIFENANDAIYLFELNEQGLPARILEVNDVACRRLGYTREEYLAMDPSQMDAPEMEVDIPASMYRLREQRHETVELVHLTKDGRRIPVEVSSHLFTVRGKTRHLAIVRDIRERKRAEEQLRASLREKEALLKEIHHRVKNNMQLVSSMISLQSQELGEHAIIELQTRVRAMALVHELLYGMQDLAHIRFDDYLGKLVRELQSTYESSNTTLNLELSEVRLPIETAVPLGLIINEIVSNTFKHAHPPGQSGHLSVELSHRNATHIRVADDGDGMRQTAYSENSLGLILIHELSKQLDAVIDISREGGTTYTIYVPEKANE
ncbi:MAG: sensor histidine kinase [Spirochaetota bacterium]